MPNVKEILVEWLKAHGYDGLAGGWHRYNCGCGVDDLVPCAASCDLCEPAYRVPCTCEDHEGFHYTTEKADGEGAE
jgi:hypothetical protein